MADLITLQDKYQFDGGQALVSGRQALVRLPMIQRELDRERGLRTAGYISGYRGSPLGGFDAELWKARKQLEAHDILFDPGLNEDLALTALAGTQQLDFLPGRRVDGVFGLWYGKGPGVDRSGDAIKHANLAGTSPSGGIVLAFGDDHAGKSSTTAHQSDLTLASWGVPVLYPATIGEILDFGLAAYAMSRFSGALVGLKLVNETAEATGVLAFGEPPRFAVPDMPAAPGGVHLRREVLAMLEQDMRLQRLKLPRAQLFSRHNKLDRITFGSPQPRLMIATAGKSYADVLAALGILGIDEPAARRAKIGVYKIALTYPLDAEGMAPLAAGAEEIFFVEEKRALAEPQAREAFYNLSSRPRITGKTDIEGAPLLPSDIPLNALLVAVALAERLRPILTNSRLGGRVAEAGAIARATLDASAAQKPIALRRPAFCPGCPHNGSTKVPEGSFGATGIGCHGMVMFHPERNPLPMGQMGAEGANWIGLSRFTEVPHIFQNLGDGTYSHSGSLAIRAAVAAGTNITYKILYNDAVAMTGGQPVEGGLTVTRIVQQVRGEGVGRVVVLSDDPDRFAGEDSLPPHTDLRHRDLLAEVQQELRATSGVTVIIYDQVCAAEKRRRRKAGQFPDPDRRVFINAEVCEGCGDCSVQSNCLAIQPLETELGRKRRIDQSACNKDFSCVKGFCPSFVIVDGARPRRRLIEAASQAASPPEPSLRPLGEGFDMVIAGVGGTGVVTVSAILGMAARVAGVGANLYDMTGLSQKGGAVFSHVRLRPAAAAVMPARVGPGEADLILACDLVAAGQPEAATTIARGRTVIVANGDLSATADFQTVRDLRLPGAELIARLGTLADRAPLVLGAAQLSQALIGDTIAANMLLLGFAWQQGVIPLERQAIEQAIRLNGVAVEANLRAFAAGRAAAADKPAETAPPQTLESFVERRVDDLTAYRNRAYADRYARLMTRVRTAASGVGGGEAFAWAVARSAYKLMAYKDEYEVARLYSHKSFRAALDREFEGIRGMKLQLAPPLLARVDKTTGRPRKMSFGRWVFVVLRALSACRGLRETPFDPFGYTAERKLERALRDAFLARIAKAAEDLTPDNLAELVELARLPMEIRGFGPVKHDAATGLLAVMNMARDVGDRSVSPRGVHA